MKHLMFAIALFASAGFAKAEPPPEGIMVSFKHAMVVCNQASQLKGLIEAQKANDFDSKMKPLMESKECQLATVRNVVVRGSEDAGIVAFGDQTEHLWIVQIDLGNKKLAALYEEIEAPKQETAI